MADEQQQGSSEAYHVLGQLNEGMEESRAELKKLRDQADQTHRELMEQLAEAQQAGDEASLERLPPLIEQAQQAWVVANEELGDDEPEPDEPSEGEAPTAPSTGRGDAERPASDREPPSEGAAGEEPGSTGETIPVDDAAGSGEAPASEA